MRTLLVLLVVSVAALAGCGSEKRAQPKPIDFKDVPPNILKVAQDTLPEVNFDAALLKPNGTYEIRGKGPNGKLREVDIRPDGTIEALSAWPCSLQRLPVAASGGRRLRLDYSISVGHRGGRS